MNGHLSSRLLGFCIYLGVYLATFITSAQPSQSAPSSKSPGSQNTRQCQELTEAGKLQAALPFCEEALAESNRQNGARHPRTSEPRANLAYLHFQRGDYEAAERLYREVIQSLAPMHEQFQFQIVMMKTALAAALDSQGKYPQVEEAYQQAITMLSKSEPSNAKQLVPVISNLAEFYRSQGKYDLAESTLQEALLVLKKANLTEDRLYAHVLNNLGELHRELGRIAYAESYLQASLALRLRVLPPKDPNIAITLNNYAELLRERGRYAEAIPMYEKAMAIRKHSLSEKHPHYVSSIENMGRLYLDQGDFARAEPLLKESLVLRERSAGIQHPLYAKTLCGLAQFHRVQGHFTEAQALLQQALAIRTRVFGHQHIQLGLVEHELALVAIGQGDERTAVAHFERALAIEEGILALADGEARLLAFVDKYQASAKHVYSLLLSKEPAAQQLAVRLLLTRKGRWLEAGLRASQILQGNNNAPGTKELFERLRTLRSQLVRRLLGNQASPDGWNANSNIPSLQAEIDELERKLLAVSGKPPQEKKLSLSTILSEVTERIGPDSALIEFVRFSPYQFQSRSSTEALRWGNARYAAVLISKQMAPRVYDLGSASTLEDAVGSLMSMLHDRRSEPQHMAKHVFQIIFAAMKNQLSKWKKIYLSTDGVLHTLPFYALHDGSKYLIDKSEFVYLTSGRDLIRNYNVSTPSVTRTALLFADPTYGDLMASAPVQPFSSKRDSAAPVYRSWELLGMAQSLTALPGSRVEVAAIAKYLPSPQVLTGAEASEANLRRIEAPWLLHLALHAGVGQLPSQPSVQPVEPGALPMADTVTLQEQQQRGLAHAAGPVPSAAPAVEETAVDLLPQHMARSALFLSGAAQAGSTSEAASDGILTAEEARDLQLHGTALVVLSACESGLGVLHASHGVFGLRRAFLVAGAETLITSLWRIDDIATAELMTGLYRQLLEVRRDRSSALKAAMKAQREKYPHPYYWAPFILIGRSDPMTFPR